MFKLLSQSMLHEINLMSFMSRCIAVCFIFIVSTVHGDDIDKDFEPWSKYRSEDGITGYEREVPNSKYIETRSEVLIDTSVEVILEVLKDIPSYPTWMHKCKEAVELTIKEDGTRFLYIVQSSPLGSPDRDVIIESSGVNQLSMGSYAISLHSTENNDFKHPETDTHNNRQRMKKFRGKWEFRSVDSNRTIVAYSIFTDPGGFAPAFIVNPMMRDVSFLTLKGLIPMVRKSHYIEAAALSPLNDLNSNR